MNELEYSEDSSFRSYCSLTLDLNDTISFIGNHYGEKQWDKLEEELEELREALNDLKVSKNVDSMSKYQAQARYKVIEEFADLLIVMQSILNTDGNEDLIDLVESIIAFKVSRQAYRIKNNDPKAGDPNYGD